ncbi:hypothetical protein EYC84_003688 [Monilinia fructicola]|uniref:Rhodopsin domain-containing protein n=1 Tax=Monilinia fructicola TaxID=38448 RepID=A0A5M9JYF0_MONFR|nr:hypothetical protein EYC84_003688 [Monilinia fructicola]
MSVTIFTLVLDCLKTFVYRGVDRFKCSATVLRYSSYATCLLRLTEASLCAYSLWAGLAINVILCFIASFYLIFNCQPISYAWTQGDSTVDGYCNYDSADALGYAWAGLSIALYLLFTLIPVALSLGLGLFAGIACAVRIGVFAVDLDYADPPLFHITDAHLVRGRSWLRDSCKLYRNITAAASAFQHPRLR